MLNLKQLRTQNAYNSDKYVQIMYNENAYSSKQSSGYQIPTFNSQNCVRVCDFTLDPAIEETEYTEGNR